MIALLAISVIGTFCFACFTIYSLIQIMIESYREYPGK